MFSAPHLDEKDTALIREFLDRCRRVDLTSEVISQAIMLRRRDRMRTPDAIVAASAITLSVALITADKQFGRVAGLSVITDIIE